jgi:glycosyltransferase involved in cell wall biosynthesis
MDSQLLKVSYVHGRSGPHPFQGKLAQSVGGEYQVVDFRIRWHDLPSSRFRRYLSWIVCALTFPNKKKYDIFLAAGPHFTLVLMRLLKQLRKNQKIIVHMGDETLYSLYANRYSKSTHSILISALKKYDALICEGKMSADIARKLLGKDALIYTVFAGIPNEHYRLNAAIKPNTGSKNILFMGNGPSGFRLWYKGLDIMLDAFAIAFASDPELKFTIIGSWEDDIIDQLLSRYDEKIRSAINFVGATNQLNEYIGKNSLYLHCARGEAFGITILIAMLAGLTPIVSEWTGAKEAVTRVDPELVVSLDKDIIAQRILWYFRLSNAEKEKLSEMSRSIAQDYTEEKAISRYQDTFKQIVLDLGINKKVNTAL